MTTIIAYHIILNYAYLLKFKYILQSYMKS